jgi:pSer/pThr/pTyr-binding forkhead associated (FHA) protein
VNDQPPRAHLRWETPEGEAREWPLGGGPVLVGRSADCDVVVADTHVSRKHAEIRCDGETFSVADLGSVNGTLVNGERVAGSGARELQDGDRVRVGPVTFLFERLSTPEPPAPERATLVVPEPATFPCLEVVSGPLKSARFDLVKIKTVVGRAGRGERWDVVLQDRAVSRPHAQVTREEQGFVLADLDSANGTLVDGEPISEPRVLADGDAITIGETVVVFRSGVD